MEPHNSYKIQVEKNEFVKTKISIVLITKYVSVSATSKGTE